MTYFDSFIIGILIGGGVAYLLFKNRFDYEQSNRKKLAGTYAERFVPFLKDYPYASEDTVHLGMPIDYIVFDGLSEGKVKDIVFIEVKTGSSELSSRQKAIEDAVTKRRIKWWKINL